MLQARRVSAGKLGLHIRGFLVKIVSLGKRRDRRGPVLLLSAGMNIRILSTLVIGDVESKTSSQQAGADKRDTHYSDCRSECRPVKLGLASITGCTSSTTGPELPSHGSMPQRWKHAARAGSVLELPGFMPSGGILGFSGAHIPPTPAYQTTPKRSNVVARSDTCG